MSFDVLGAFNQLTSRAAELGIFDRVTGHEPKAAPSSTGVSCAVWIGEMRPAHSSGLNSVSIRVEFQFRVFTSMLSEPQDDIDPRIVGAVDLLLTALIGGFSLAGSIRALDIFGSDGESLRAIPGYLTQDSKPFRVMDVFVPLILNDVYTETA